MDSNTARKLMRLNRRFYDHFALEFSRTRRSVTAGVRRALEHLAGTRRMLDLGCGDGRVGRHLSTLPAARRPSLYLGIDCSPALLAMHEKTQGFACTGYRLVLGDVTRRSWADDLDLKPGDFEGTFCLAPGMFDGALCLAVLFHIPGRLRRLRFLRRMHSFLAPESTAVVSVWQFLHLERFRRKILPWGELGLDRGALEPGDLLIDWQGRERGLRYVHHFHPAELEQLCGEAGFRVTRRYVEDGATRDLSLYLVLQRTSRTWRE